jgi:protein-disulfide isomerase
MRNFLLISLLGLAILSCDQVNASKEAPRPNFVYKESADSKLAARIMGQDVTFAELNSGIESDIYEAELKLYELKENRLRALLLERLMAADPKKAGMSNDEYLEKVIAAKITVAEKDIEAFIKERGIDQKNLTPELKERVRGYLEMEEKRKSVDRWMAAQTKKTPVEVFFAKPTPPVFPVTAGDAPWLGGENAKVTVIEFSDFQCPFCAKGAEVITELKKKYGNKIKIAFKNFPLPFHQHAQGAAEAGLCVHESDPKKFWAFHDEMFKDQAGLDEAGLKAKAQKVGADMKAYDACVGAKKFAAKVNADMEEGKKVGVKSTPTFFVNGKMINGAQPLHVFSELIDQDLK